MQSFQTKTKTTCCSAVTAESCGSPHAAVCDAHENHQPALPVGNFVFISTYEVHLQTCASHNVVLIHLRTAYAKQSALHVAVPARLASSG